MVGSAPSSEGSSPAQPTAERPVDWTGASVTVTYGEEVFSPVQYQSFRVGPFSITRTVRSDETAESVYASIEEELQQMSNRQFELRLRSFKERIEKTSGKGGR